MRRAVAGPGVEHFGKFPAKSVGSRPDWRSTPSMALQGLTLRAACDRDEPGRSQSARHGGDVQCNALGISLELSSRSTCGQSILKQPRDAGHQIGKCPARVARSADVVYIQIIVLSMRTA